MTRKVQTRLTMASAAIVGLALLGSCAEDAPGLGGSDLAANDWLLSADSDAARFERLQQQLRGFDQPMWEVGERYLSLHAALERENYDLALYHWDKIGTTIENGIAKRPGRAANARNLFLEGPFHEVRAGLEQRAPDAAWQAFSLARSTCMSCHQAEAVGYMNNQPLFDLPIGAVSEKTPE